MKYPYTWNHLSLFAKLCEKRDEEESITSSWIKTVEDHHSTTFPFTLWPLSYRTSEITTSPSISSPLLFKISGAVCDITIGMYICNEVMMICVQNGTLNSICEKLSTIPKDGCADHKENHREDFLEYLLPCSVIQCYVLIKNDILSRVYRAHRDSINSEDSINCIICIGHGFSASIASCLASDIGNTYETQRKFLGLDHKLVCVDFVGFSYSPPLASRRYWESTEGNIDKYILVSTNRSRPNQHGRAVSNPELSHVYIGPCLSTDKMSRETPSKSIFKRRVNAKGAIKNENIGISEYVSGINKNILPTFS